MNFKKNKNTIIIILVVVILLVAGFFGVKQWLYTRTDEYRLKKIGYSSEQIETILNKKDLNIEFVLKNDYSDKLTDFISARYYINDRLERYLNYYKNHTDKEVKRVVSIVNANTDKPAYSDIKEVDGNDYLVMVNKYYKLKSDYTPTDLVNVSQQWAYSGHKLRTEANTNFATMALEASRSDLTFIVSTSYRTAEKQEQLYNSAGNDADKKAARVGHSDHQTGLAVDITIPMKDVVSYEETDEYKWLIENAHRFGFIFRYPKDKEDITGFTYEPWHLRYVGVDAATKMYNEDLTFDEYYTYYIESGLQ